MIDAIQAISLVATEVTQSTQVQPEQPLSDFVSRLGETPDEAVARVENFIVGEPTELHTLMIELEMAKLQMQLAVEIRDKLVEAYQELSRMQV